MAVRSVEAYWLALTFDLKTSDAKLIQLRPKFQQAWDNRKKAFDAAQAKHDRESLWNSLKKVNGTLEIALKKVLGEGQFRKLKESLDRHTMRPRNGWEQKRQPQGKGR